MVERLPHQFELPSKSAHFALEAEYLELERAQEHVVTSLQRGSHDLEQSGALDQEASEFVTQQLALVLQRLGLRVSFGEDRHGPSG
jgi:hypothetical protein